MQPGVNIEDRNHFVAQHDHPFDERRRRGHARRAAVHDDLADGHNVHEEGFRADAKGDETEIGAWRVEGGGCAAALLFAFPPTARRPLPASHARTRNFRISSSKPRMASDSSVSVSLISLAEIRFSSAIVRTCSIVFMIFSLSMVWLLAA